MPNGPQKLILINAGRYDYAEVELGGTLQIVGPNNTGKTSLINTLQFLYLDDRRQMDFGHSPEATRDHYFPNQYSYVLFECLGARGKFVLGWRGQSKAAGGEPERFYYEGEFASSDFVAEQDQVREPRAVSAKLSGKNYTTLKSAQDHRELLLQATKGEGQGTGIVALRDNDKYPHFREILKNLLCLSTITQDQMRDRLLMLAGLPTEKHALDVRELFGEEYRNILDQKQKLVRFKKHQDQIETLVDICARRDTIRGELIYRWSDLKAKQKTFETAYSSNIEKLQKDAQGAAERIQTLQAEVNDRRADEQTHAKKFGSLESQLNQLAEQAKEFRDFVEDIEREALKNARAEINRLERELGDSENKTRREAENKIQVYGDLVKQKKTTIAHFDRALVTVLRRKLSDDELAPLAQLFNFDVLHQPVGADGVRLHKHDEFVRLLKALARRIENNVYRDELVELPLPASQHSLAQLANPDALRDRLMEDEKRSPTGRLS
jgi:DNA repair exonuclease SbcCD ATPase subunit